MNKIQSIFLLMILSLIATATCFADPQPICTQDMVTPGSPNFNQRCHDDFYKQQWLENQRQQIELEKQQFAHQERMDDYNIKMQKQQMRQQRIAQIQKQCSQKTAQQMGASEQILCNAVNNHISYGTPLSDAQLGL